MKLNITYVGTPKDIETKFGKKQKNSIKASEHGDKFLSYWVSPQTKDWAVGKEVEVADITSREYNGKTYWDIVMPKVDNRPGAGFDTKILTEIANGITTLKLQNQKIIDHLSGKGRLDRTSTGQPIPFQDTVEDINPDDIPL